MSAVKIRDTLPCKNLSIQGIEETRTLLAVEGLSCAYRSASGKALTVVDQVSFKIRDGETLGLVGESGCGKSTTAKALVGLVEVSNGTVSLEGQLISELAGRHRKELGGKLQMVFQDPISSLNPRRKCADIVAEPLLIRGGWQRHDRERKVAEVLGFVGFDPSAVWNRRPYQFSGGQCQRISLARALVDEPKILICDEPVSALDVSVQAQILNLMQEMRTRYNLTMLFVSHDLGVIRHVSDRVAVMYLGKMCEVAPVETLFNRPAHPYSAALLASIPSVTNPVDFLHSNPPLEGELPSISSPPSGCRFRTRCPRAQEVCAEVTPRMEGVGKEHTVACHFPLD